MKLHLPDTSGVMQPYAMSGRVAPTTRLPRDPARIVFSAAHVVADPLRTGPTGPAALDWEATLAFRRYLDGLGLGIAEAMDTAQRGMGLDWPGALELIRQTCVELPGARVFSGAGTDHLDPDDARTLADVERAYALQIQEIQAVGGRIILMASRALARVARSPEDYIAVYERALAGCDQPVILHWLGDMFDPALRGYWAPDFETAMEACLAVIEANPDKVDGIKISLLDKDKEILMRRRLPSGVKMYTGDDFNYPELIEGDAQGFSHALLGIFDPLAGLAADAVARLGTGDVAGFREVMDPTVPLARLIFRAPTQYYKTGVVFLAWLNGHQDHFVMVGGQQSMRPLSDFVEIFRLADGCGALRDPDLAAARMGQLMRLNGL